METLEEKIILAKRVYKNDWNKRNREKVNAYQRAWRKANNDKVKENQNRYWRKKAMEVLDV